MVSATVQESVSRYLKDRHAFRREQIILPDGRTYGQAEEPWQAEHIFAPWTPRMATGR